MTAALKEPKEKPASLIVVEEQRAPARQLPTVAPDASSLMRIIDRAALDPHFDVAKLKELLEVKERWDREEARKAYIAAMADFKANPPTVYKDKENKQYDSRYTSIGNLVNTVNAALSPHGLTARWDLDQSAGIKITCVLTHRMGHSESCSMTGPLDTSGQKNPLQQLKSTTTYLKIATFEAVTGLASSNGNADDDGNAAGGKGMDDGVLADHLAAIDAAADEAGLKKAFAPAWKAAEAANDNQAKRLLTKHKDARKKTLGVKS